MVKKLRKGGLAKLKIDACKLDWSDTTIVPDAYYKWNDTDVTNWYERRRQSLREANAAGEDTFSIAFDSAGESRLPPKYSSVELSPDLVYTVMRARCRVSLGYGNPRAGMAKLLNTKTGQEVYIERKYLEAV